MKYFNVVYQVCNGDGMNEWIRLYYSNIQRGFQFLSDRIIQFNDYET